MSKKINNIDLANKIAIENDGYCQSDIYINNSSKITWMCNKKHIWQASLRSVKDNNTWCPHIECFGKKIHNSKWKNRISECDKIASNKNGFCLTRNYIDTKTKMHWKCSCGYEWFSIFDHVRRGSWCPQCSNKNKTQKKLFNIIKDIFPNKKILYNFKGFDWLKTNSGHYQELDIYIPDLKLAIEYDGRQHFEPVCFGGIDIEKAKINLNKTKNLDKIKDIKILQHSEDIFYFIRFNYKEKITEKYIYKKLISAGIIFYNYPPCNSSGISQ